MGLNQNHQDQTTPVLQISVSPLRKTLSKIWINKFG